MILQFFPSFCLQIGSISRDNTLQEHTKITIFHVSQQDFPPHAAHFNITKCPAAPVSTGLRGIKSSVDYFSTCMAAARSSAKATPSDWATRASEKRSAAAGPLPVTTLGVATTLSVCHSACGAPFSKPG